MHRVLIYELLFFLLRLFFSFSPLKAMCYIFFLMLIRNGVHGELVSRGLLHLLLRVVILVPLGGWEETGGWSMMIGIFLFSSFLYFLFNLLSQAEIKIVLLDDFLCRVGLLLCLSSC